MKNFEFPNASVLKQWKHKKIATDSNIMEKYLPSSAIDGLNEIIIKIKNCALIGGNKYEFTSDKCGFIDWDRREAKLIKTFFEANGYKVSTHDDDLSRYGYYSHVRHYMTVSW